MRQQDDIRGSKESAGASSAGGPEQNDGLHDGSARPPRQRSGAHDAMGPGPGNGPQEPRKRPRRRILRWTAVTLAVLVLATAGLGYLYLRHLNGNLDKADLSLGDSKLDAAGPNAEGQRPLNILLLGSDSRNSDENAALGGARHTRGRKPLADVQMLLHLSADRSSMSVVSVPRDTRVTIPKCTDPQTGEVYPETTAKINTSLQHGGPGCTVATWEALTGIPVNHFMMIDFAGVVSMADAVGGVPVCVDANVHDPKSGLRLEEGTSVVKGEHALQWLRTRHGFEDGTDIGRAKAQHMYMTSMVRQLREGTKLTDPGKLRNLAEAATEALTVDHGLGSVQKLYELAGELKKVPTERITMVTMPWRYAAGGSYVLPKQEEAEQIWSLIRQDIALDGKDAKKPESAKSAEPSDPAAPKSRIAVSVLNGTGTIGQAAVPGRAGLLTEKLVNLGFTAATVNPAPQPQRDTTVTYGSPDQHGDALAVARALGVPGHLVKHSSAVDQVTLVVGADWRTGTTYPAEAGGESEEPDPGVPEDTEVLQGDDKDACMHVNPVYTW